MIYKEPSDKPGKVRATFELPASIWADRVNLCGDFNDWRLLLRHTNPCEGSRVDSAPAVISQGENRFTGNAIRNLRKGG